MRKIRLDFMWLLAFMCLLPLSASGQSYTYAIGDKVTSDQGVFKIVSENLITNPSFDNGTEGWTAGDAKPMTGDNFAVQPSGGADGGAYLKALSNAGSGKAQSVRTAWQLQPGKTYFISLWSKSAGTWANIYTSRTATSTETTIVNVPNSSDWVQTTAIFTPADEYTYCVANFAWLGSSACFDCFFLGELESTGELNKEPLLQAVADAEAVLAETTEGTGFGEYTAEVRAELQKAIDEAKALLESAGSQNEITDGTSALNAAVQNYYNSVNPPFVVGEKYVFIHAGSGLYLTNSSSTMKITADNGLENQAFTFVPAPEGAAAKGYNMLDGEGNYVYRSGSWDTKAGQNISPTDVNAIFKVEADGDYFQIRNMGSGSVLGTDGTSDGSSVYSNKNGTGVANYDWSMEKFVPLADRDDEYYFGKKLQEAKNKLNSIDPDLCGNNPFDYSLEAYNTFKAAVEHAEGVTSDFTAELKALEDAMTAFTENGLVAPDPDKIYVITQSSGMQLTYVSGASPSLKTPEGSEGQKYQIVDNGDGSYSLLNLGSKTYVAKLASSGYDMTWATDNSANEARWYISPGLTGYKVIQNVAGKGHIGSDSTADGAYTYCDKSSGAANSQWTIEEFSVTSALDKVIVSAEELLSSTPVGTEYYEVPQSAADEFSAAIAAAKEAKGSVTTVGEAMALASQLEEAMDVFNSSYNEIKDFDATYSYKFVHSGGNVLTFGEKGATIEAPAEEGSEEALAQQFELVPVEVSDDADGLLPLTYQIKDVNQGYYLAQSGTYNTSWVEDETDEATYVQVVRASGKYLGVKFLKNSGFMGTNSSAAASAVYSDKNASTDANACWLILEADAIVTFDKTALKNALDAASALQESMVWGNEVGQYYQADIDAFADIVENYNRIYRTSKDEAEVNAAAVELNKLIEEYKGKAHAETIDMLLVAKDVLDAAEAAYAEASANIGLDKGQYTQSACDAFRKFIDDFKAAPTLEVMYTISDETAKFVAGKITVDRTALGTAIAEAQTVYDGLSIGEFNGQTPKEAADALAAAITEAKAVYETAPEHSQADINSQVSALGTAVETCKGQMVVVDFTALDSVIDVLSNLVETTVNVGEGQGQCPTIVFDEAKSALADAEGVDRAAISQVDVDGVVEATSAAVDEFAAALKDASGLQALIESSYDVYDKLNSSMVSIVEKAKFRKAIETAESVMAAPVATQEQLTSAYNELKAIYDKYDEIYTTDIDAVDSESLNVSVSDGRIELSGLAQDAVVVVYSMDGRMVARESGENVSIAVPAGKYVVRVVADGKAVSRVVMMR